jgi:hypothetical protein
MTSGATKKLEPQPSDDDNSPGSSSTPTTFPVTEEAKKP